MPGHVRRRCPKPAPGTPACSGNCGHAWAYVIEQPAAQDGRRRQVWKSGFATKRAASAALAEALVAASKPAASRITVSEHITRWLAHLDRKPATLQTYRRIVEQRVVPGLGAKLLVEVSPNDLRSFYAALIDEGLSTSTVQLIHQVLNKCLGDAEREGVLPRNPCRSVDAPRKAVFEMRTWSSEQVQTFLRHVSHERLHAMWRLFLTTGMRRGEVAALRWIDVDLDHARLSVRQTGNVIERVWTVGTPKGRGRGATRMLSLDPQTVNILRRHREQQEQERANAEDIWQEHGLVFCREDGTPLNPTRIGHLLSTRYTRLGLPPIRVHDLRHTYATLALLAGIHPKVVSERLGHANIGITLNLYSHVTEGMDRAAAELVAQLLDDQP